MANSALTRSLSLSLHLPQTPPLPTNEINILSVWEQDVDPLTLKGISEHTTMRHEVEWQDGTHAHIRTHAHAHTALSPAC